MSVIKSYLVSLGYSVVVLLFPFAIQAQELITNVFNRNTTSLNGEWTYIVDPYETGYYNYRHKPYDQTDTGSSAAFYNNYHTQDKSELVEYDFDKSLTLDVPGDWNSQKENLLYYEGTIWLKRSFDYASLKKDNRLFLYFGAVNYKAEVYLNGTKLGTHEGGFTPFNFEVTKIVKPRGNYLVVKADNRRLKEAVPTDNTDWWNYGGITRDVMLIEEPPVFIQDYTVQLKKGDANTLAGFVKLSRAAASEKLVISIPELHVQQTLTTDTSGYVPFTIPVKKLLFWSPESPKLYEVHIQTRYQDLRDDIGFRTIETRGQDILLNGKPVFLRGIALHEENPMRQARAYNDADALVALTWAKELGCNYVRLAHYPHNEYIVKLADRLGMMLWEEIPVYWTIDFKNQETLDNAKSQLTALITRDRNRAASIIWSVANETPVSNARTAFLVNLIHHARSLDSTRLISAALERHRSEGINILDDTIGRWLDIVAFNQYIGWYNGSPDQALRAKWKITYNKPVIISEFGGGALQGLHGSKEERWTEEYQDYLYQQNLKMIEKIPGVRGMSPWVLADFRSPKRLLPGVQDGWNRKGLISNRGVRKKAFYTLQAFYKTLTDSKN
jgi:beta-glucuronidase